MASKLGKTGAKPPISAHRAFPAIVALWFAALFGLGSLVLPVALIEGLVNAAGISSVISAAEPPLGATTRIIIALLAAGIGVVLGLFLARKVKASNAPEPVRQRAATLDQAAKQPADQTAEGSVPEAKRPISAHEELGSEFLDDPVDADDADDADDFDDTDIDADSGFQRPPHRRALAMNDEGALSEFFSDVPLPGDDGHTHEGSAEDNYSDDALPGFDGLAEATAQVFEEPAHDITDDTVDAASDDLLELAPFADDDADAPLALEEPQIQLQTTLVTEPEEAPSMTPENNQDTREAATGYNPFAAQAAAMPEPAARPFAAPQMQAETAEEGQPAGYDASTDAQESLTGSLTGLSMPELVERFSRALEARSAHNDAAGKDPLVTGSNEPDLVLPSFAAKSAQPQAAPQAAPQSAPVAVDAPTAIPAARIEEAPVAAPAVPFALQPIGAEDDDSEDEGEAENADNGLTLDLNTASRRQFAQPDSAESASTDQPAEQPVMPVPFEERVAAFSASALEADDLDEDDLEDGYSSLLAMKSPISPGRDFVRIEDELGEADESDSEAEPVVVFPGQEQRPAAPAGQFFARGGSAAAATAAAPDDRPFAPPTEGRVAPSTATQPGSESEVALREALEKLQKLSGAG